LQGEGRLVELQGAGKVNIEVDGTVSTVIMAAGQKCVIEVPAAVNGVRRCRLTKSGSEYPWILGVSLLK